MDDMYLQMPSQDCVMRMVMEDELHPNLFTYYECVEDQKTLIALCALFDFDLEQEYEAYVNQLAVDEEMYFALADDLQDISLKSIQPNVIAKKSPVTCEYDMTGFTNSSLVNDLEMIRPQWLRFPVDDHRTPAPMEIPLDEELQEDVSVELEVSSSCKKIKPPRPRVHDRYLQTLMEALEDTQEINFYNLQYERRGRKRKADEIGQEDREKLTRAIHAQNLITVTQQMSRKLEQSKRLVIVSQSKVEQFQENVQEFGINVEEFSGLDIQGKRIYIPKSNTRSIASYCMMVSKLLYTDNRQTTYAIEKGGMQQAIQSTQPGTSSGAQSVVYQTIFDEVEPEEKESPQKKVRKTRFGPEIPDRNNVVIPSDENSTGSCQKDNQ